MSLAQVMLEKCKNYFVINSVRPVNNKDIVTVDVPKIKTME